MRHSVTSACPNATNRSRRRVIATSVLSHAGSAARQAATRERITEAGRGRAREATLARSAGASITEAGVDLVGDPTPLGQRPVNAREIPAANGPPYDGGVQRYSTQIFSMRGLSACMAE
jgi:hypothetical protein